MEDFWLELAGFGLESPVRSCRTSQWAMLAVPHAHLNTGTPADSGPHYTPWPIAGSPQIEGSRPVLRVPAEVPGVAQNTLFPMWSIVTIPDLRAEVVCPYPPRQRANHFGASRVRRQASSKGGIQCSARISAKYRHTFCWRCAVPAASLQSHLASAH